jgi:glycogen operon protein
MDVWFSEEGAPIPGVTYVPGLDAYNFGLYSKRATGVTLHLYGEGDVSNPLHSITFDRLHNKTSRVWHVMVPSTLVEQAAYYAYTVDGPSQPDDGYRFDQDKVLLDPMARGVHFPPDFDRDAASVPGSNAGRAPLGVLDCVRKAYDWAGDRRPQRHGHDLVMYELHVRGFTKSHTSPVPNDRRGTYAGIIDMIPYLKDLGVTAVELMPVFQADPQEGSYWGYMTLGFLALHGQYAAADGVVEQLDEFRDMVKALHQADIEVILDVVYNHTTEGDEHGPTYSFRGIDNSTYYLLGSDRGTYRNDTGCGNVVNAAHRYTRTFILDSLRYWVHEMHVDGFRFDLATIFTRDADGNVNLSDPPILTSIRTDPVLRDVRLIAEAWDIDTYQLGRSFPGLLWSQWNGKYRDAMRSFVKGDSGRVPEVMRRIYGSDDLFPDTLLDAFRPYQGVNFTTVHDGFTLYDLVAYSQKHNEANGHDDTDGSDDNRSWNCGWEGDDGVPDEVMELRVRQAKNFMTLLMMSNGSPLIRGGDEFLDTQFGNNNAYNQDNGTSWLDWSRQERFSDFHRFVKKLIAFRAAHPSIGRSTFWRDDVSWHGIGADIDTSDSSHSLAYLLEGASEDDDDLYVMVNTWWEPLTFAVQDGSPGQWHRAIDTGAETPGDIAEDLVGEPLASIDVEVAPRSIAVLVRPRAM